MNVAIFAKTDKGKHYNQNEDACSFCCDLSHPEWGKQDAMAKLGSCGCLLAVADGMGGAKAGEIASNLAIETIKRKFSDIEALREAIASDIDILRFLQTVFEEANSVIKQYALGHIEAMGLGTTLVVCWIIDDKAYIAWCGDSRCYTFNPYFGLTALTKDHSYVQELINKGELTEEEALTHPESNIITKGLGDLNIDTPAETTIYSIQPDDAFLLCSDGLSGYCDKKTIEKSLKANYPDLKTCCNNLIGLALDTGGYDNISVAIASLSENAIISNKTRLLSLLKKFMLKLFKRQP